MSRLSLERLNFFDFGLRPNDVEECSIPGNEVCRLYFGQDVLEGKLIGFDVVEMRF